MSSAVADPMSPALPREALEEINRLWTITRALSCAAHDVNNALQVIRGSAEMLEGRPELDDRMQRRVQAIRQQADRAAQVLDTLVGYARDADETPGPVNVRELTATALALRESSLRRMRIGVTIFSSSAEPFVALVGPRSGLQLFLNLLLYAEQLLADRTETVVRVRVTGQPVVVDIRLTAEDPAALHQLISATSHVARRPREVHAITGGGQLQAARLLAADQNGSVDVETDAAGHEVVVLTLSAPGTEKPAPKSRAGYQ